MATPKLRASCTNLVRHSGRARRAERLYASGTQRKPQHPVFGQEPDVHPIAADALHAVHLFEHFSGPSVVHPMRPGHDGGAHEPAAIARFRQADQVEMRPHGRPTWESSAVMTRNPFAKGFRPSPGIGLDAASTARSSRRTEGTAGSAAPATTGDTGWRDTAAGADGNSAQYQAPPITASRPTASTGLDIGR